MCILAPSVTPPLHDYQELAISFLRHQPRAGLFLDCGYGKTRIVLEALEPRHLPALVVAPKRVAEQVWPEERDLWRPGLSMALAVGNPNQRKAALAQQADITVIGRDSLKDITKPNYRTVVFDELSAYKSKNVRWKQGHRVSKNADTIWGLTGTPSPNGMMDVWAQVLLLDEGARLGRNITIFRDRYFNPGRRLPTGTVIEWKIRPESADAIHRKIEDICLSITDKIKLPDITYNRISVEISKPIRDAYIEYKRELLVDLEMLGGDVHTAANQAVLTGKLSQMTAGFLYKDNRGDGYTWLHDGKLEALQEVRAGTEDNLLVFYRFGAERDAIATKFPGARHISEKGVIQDWNAGKVPMLLSHPASAAHGLNLQHGGHTIVWMSLDWSLELWHQANSRLHRQGQDNPVMIHIVEVTNSIDRFILRRIHGKKDVQDSLMNHLASPM